MSGLGAHPRTEKAQFVFECLKTLRGPSPYLRLRATAGTTAGVTAGAAAREEAGAATGGPAGTRLGSPR